MHNIRQQEKKSPAICENVIISALCTKIFVIQDESLETLKRKKNYIDILLLSLSEINYKKNTDMQIGK
jgi:hypothetical protein